MTNPYAKKPSDGSTEEKLYAFESVKVGRTNILRVLKRLPQGAYLVANDEREEILLPNRYLPENCTDDMLLKVFVYHDSEDRLIATNETPYAQVGESAYLKVVDVNKVGAFLDIGLMKDLFVPYGEQEQRMNVGESYVVHLYLDEYSGRITASSKLDKYLLEESNYHKAQQPVDLLVYGKSDLGYKAVIKASVGTDYIGLLYDNEIFQDIAIGDMLKGYIKNVRRDKKIDLTLNKPMEKVRGDLANQILDFLEQQGGESTLGDKSPPEEIYKQFNVSKGAYKKALGALYKRKLIVFDGNLVKLV